MVLRLLPCVAVYSRHGAGFDIAGFDVLKSLQADVVEKEEGLLTNSLAMVKKLTVRFLPLCRSAHVVTLEHRRLKSVSHDLTHDEKIKLIVTQFSERGSEGAIVLASSDLCHRYPSSRHVESARYCIHLLINLAGILVC